MGVSNSFKVNPVGGGGKHFEANPLGVYNAVEANLVAEGVGKNIKANVARVGNHFEVNLVEGGGKHFKVNSLGVGNAVEPNIVEERTGKYIKANLV